MPNDKSDYAEQEAFLANEAVQLLRQHDKGRLAEQLEEELQEVVAAVRRHGKKGSVTLKITVKPDDEDCEQLIVSPECSNTVPQASSPSRTYFATKTNGLSRHHPDQLSLFGE